MLPVGGQSFFPSLYRYIGAATLGPAGVDESWPYRSLELLLRNSLAFLSALQPLDSFLLLRRDRVLATCLLLSTIDCLLIFARTWVPDERVRETWPGRGGFRGQVRDRGRVEDV